MACVTPSAARSTPTAPAVPTRRGDPDVIRKSLAGMNPMPIYGTGKQERTFTWLADIADGDVCAMGSRRRSARRSTSPGARRHRWRSSAQLCWEACGRDPDELRLSLEPSPKDLDAARRFASLEKARELLGWEAQVSMEEGVAQTVEWLRDTEVAA